MAPPNGLEDRLRGLILGNAGTINHSQATLSNPSLLDSQRSSVSATGDGMNDTEESKLPLSYPSSQQENANLGRNKKPNQAQRRQMNSQLSLPIDPRPQGRGYGSRGSHSQQWIAPRQTYQSHHAPSRHPNSPGLQTIPPLSPYDARMQLPNSQGQSPMLSAHSMYSPMSSPLGGMDLQNQRSPVTRNWRSEQSQGQFESRPQPTNRQLYQPGNQIGRTRDTNLFNENAIQAQSEYLQSVIENHVDKIAIESCEIDEKEAFRVVLERACRDAIKKHEFHLGHIQFDPNTIKLKCFGSMASGFATKSSDMDLALETTLTPRPDSSQSEIPRLLEKTLLDLGFGTRLLTKTRVPIIKVCERPTKGLMCDLLDERLKFEKGFVEDCSKAQGDVESSKETAATVPCLLAPGSDIAATPSVEISQTPEELSYNNVLFSLQQQENQLLADYYGTAKRVLHKLDGYDVGLSGSRTVALPAEKMKILNDVSKAFVYGISDDGVKNALININSLGAESEQFLPVSLSGVYCQAEIERLATKWATRRIREKDEKLEEQCSHIVMEWNQLSWQSPENPAVQNRQLYILLDRIKRINSLQFAALQQTAYEDPNQYYQRMNRLLQEPVIDPKLLPAVFSQYIKGVSDPSIQNRLLILVKGLGKERMSQDALLFHHSILHLAKEYERALAAGLYDEAERPVIEAYVSRVLRGSENLNWNDTETFFDDLINSPEAMELISRVKKLPAPTDRPKARDHYFDHLSFPPDDSVGIQCDINFSADLAVINTHLLRCYAAADPRVRPLVLFVKSWASRRNINTPYRGTLSSYGYVLMVLHYLVNVASPFVLPNLQLLRRPPPPHLSPAEAAALDTCNGLDVGFWRDEKEIGDLAAKNLLNHNQESMGRLLRGFFEYYANNGGMYRGFDWGREVLSLRTQGGILTKNEKDWVGARTTTETITTTHANPRAEITSPSESKDGASDTKSPTTTQSITPKTIKIEETKEIRHRYLFAIEDPFEIDHNVARTVTHNGIVSIRDEFRRAWKIIREQGVGAQKGKEKESSTPNVDLLAEVGVEGKIGKDGKGGAAAANSGGERYKPLMDQIMERGLKGYVARGGTVKGFMEKDGFAVTN